MPKVGDVVVCKYLDIIHPNRAWMCSYIGKRDSRSQGFPLTFGAEDSGIYKDLIFEFRSFDPKCEGTMTRKIFGYEVEGMIVLDAMRIVDISSYIF